MLLPGVRLVERPGVLHLFDGRQVVSFRGDEGGRRAIRQAIGSGDGLGTETGGDDGVRAEAVHDARELLQRLRLGVPDADRGGDAVPVGVAFASAAVAGWVSPREADERLRELAIRVWDGTDGGLSRALSGSGLNSASLQGVAEIAELDPERHLVAVVADDVHPARRLYEVNQACLARGVSWLSVGAYDGAVVRVGPLMIPGQTACAECLSRRLAANVEYADVYRDIADVPAAPTPAAVREWAYSVATLILLRWIATRDVRLPGRLFTLVPDELEIRQASVYRVPRCTRCAGPDFVTAAAPWDIARDH